MSTGSPVRANSLGSSRRFVTPHLEGDLLMRRQEKTKQGSRSGGRRGTRSPTLDFAVVGAPLWVLGVLHGRAVFFAMAVATTILLLSQGGVRSRAVGARWISARMLRFVEI